MDADAIQQLNNESVNKICTRCQRRLGTEIYYNVKDSDFRSKVVCFECVKEGDHI